MRFTVLRLLTAAFIVTAAAVSMVGCGSEDDLASSGSTAARSGAPRHVLYFSEFSVHEELTRLLPHGPGPLERVEAFRQLPAEQTILPPAFRLARRDGVTIAKLPAKAIARELRTAIDGTCTAAMQCQSHLVTIDDISTEFLGSAGGRLRAAMALLDFPSPWGGTYAQRVMMYVPIQMMRGLQQTPAAWANALHAVAAGESYWLEMYESAERGVVSDVSYEDWTTGVEATVAAINAAGGRTARTHLMIGPGTGRIVGMPASMCPAGVGCAWKAVEATALNRALLQNGNGLYRIGPRQLTVLCLTAYEERGVDAATRRTVVKICDRWTRTAPHQHS